MHDYLIILLATTIPLILLALLVGDWIAQRRIADVSVTPWNTQWLNFALFVWLIFVAILLAQQTAFLLVADDIALDDRPLGILVPTLAMHCVVILIMLVGPTRLPDLFPSPTSGLPPLVAAPLGALLFLAGLPLVWGSAFLWTYFRNLWKKLGVTIDTPQQELVAIIRDSDSLPFLALVAFIAVVLAPVSEELVFRRGIYRFLKGKISPLAALTVSSLLFAMIHFNIQSFLALFTLGMLLGRAYERTGSVATPILYHSFFNLTTILIITLLPPELTIDPVGFIPLP